MRKANENNGENLPQSTQTESEYLKKFHEVQTLHAKGGLVEAPEDEDIIIEKKQRIPDYENFFDGEQSKKKNASAILKGLFKKNIGSLLFLMLLAVIRDSSAWIIPIASANIINAIVTPTENTLNVILINIAVLLVSVLLHLPVFTIWGRFTGKMIRKISSGFRNTLIKKLQHLSFTKQKDLETGKIHSKLLRDIDAVEAFNGNFIHTLIPALLMALITMGITLTKSKAVSLFFICVIPVNAVVVYMFRKKLSEVAKDMRKENEKFSSKVSNMLDMMALTKAHGLENEEINSVQKDIVSLYKSGVKNDYAATNFLNILFVMSQCLRALCLLFTAFLAVRKLIPVGDIVIYQSYFTEISARVQAILGVFPVFTKGVDSIKSMADVISSDDIENNKNKINLRYVHGTIDFKNVSYTYPGSEKKVINNFSLHVDAGECIAFVGSSGSGKSTIMNMIIGFLQATDGQISIDGKPMDAINLSDYRHFISVVPQSSVLFDGTIRENILYGKVEIDEERFNQALEDANINEFIKDLPNGIDTIVGEGGDRLSGGQKQRISIARALIRDPKILILDEATSALDNKSEFQVQKAIQNLIQNRTTFIVAHRLSTIRNADRIVVMENGRCVEMGTYNELMEKKGKFFELKVLSEINAQAD